MESKFKSFIRNEFTKEEIIEMGTYGCVLGIKGLDTDQAVIYQYITYSDDLWKIINKMSKSLDLSEFEILDYRKRYPNLEQPMSHELLCKMIVWTCAEIISREILSEEKDAD